MSGESGEELPVESPQETEEGVQPGAPTDDAEEQKGEVTQAEGGVEEAPTEAPATVEDPPAEAAEVPAAEVPAAEVPAAEEAKEVPHAPEAESSVTMSNALKPKAPPKPAPALVKPKHKRPAYISGETAEARAPALSVPNRRAPAPPLIRASSDEKFTFSAAPNSVRAKPHERQDYSHNRFQEMKMAMDNNKLCKKLMEISITSHSDDYKNIRTIAAAPIGRLAPANVAPASINRRRKEDVIAQENLAFYKRLQATKPNKDVDRTKLAKSFQQSLGYRDNASKFRPIALLSRPAMFLAKDDEAMAYAAMAEDGADESYDKANVQQMSAAKKKAPPVPPQAPVNPKDEQQAEASELKVDEVQSNPVQKDDNGSSGEPVVEIAAEPEGEAAVKPAAEPAAEPNAEEQIVGAPEEADPAADPVETEDVDRRQSEAAEPIEESA